MLTQEKKIEEIIKAYNVFMQNEYLENGIESIPEDGKLFVLDVNDEMSRDVSIYYDTETENYVMKVLGIERGIFTPPEDLIYYDKQPLEDAVKDFESLSFYDFYDKILEVEKDNSIQVYPEQQMNGGPYYD